MKKIISLVLALVMMTGTLACLASCGGEPEDSGAEIAVYLGEEIYDFDPTDYYANSNAEMLMSLLYEPLFKVNENGKLDKAAASNYSVDEEERTITVEIRETYWSDEVRVKAEDYIYAWRNRILDPNNANPAAALFYDIENAIEVKNGEKSIYDFGAVASNVYEITITYREGADYNRILRNLASVAASPAREDIVNTASGYWSKISSTVVTNGPFKIDELSVSEKKFTIGRNLGYHQKSSDADFDKNVTPASLVSFVNGAGNGISLSCADIEEKTIFYMTDANLADRVEYKDKAKVYDDLSTYTYVFNTENELFKIPEVRRALSLALDRVAMANAVTFAKPASSFVSASIADKLYAAMEKPAAAEQNMTLAKELVASVSLEGISKAFTLTVNNDEESLALANLAKNAWRELGFDVTVIAAKSVKNNVYDAITSEDIEIIDSGIQTMIKDASYGVRNFDVIAVDWQMYSDDPFVALSAFTSYMNGCGADFTTNKFRTNISAWWSGSYDSYMQSAYAAETEEERNEALRAAEAVLLESCPVIPVLYNQTFAFSSKYISGVSVDGYGNLIFNKMSQWNYKEFLAGNTNDNEEEDDGTEEDED